MQIGQQIPFLSLCTRDGEYLIQFSKYFVVLFPRTPSSRHSGSQIALNDAIPTHPEPRFEVHVNAQRHPLWVLWFVLFIFM